MLTLTPQLLVSTVTALVTWERQQKAPRAPTSRDRADEKQSEASLRFVHLVGFWSHFIYGRECSSWPLPRFERIEDLARFAERNHGLAPSPQPGDIFLLASAVGDRHVLAGIVVAIELATTMLNGRPAYVCVTAEGEVGGTVASPRVAKVRLVRRRLAPAYSDRFIRWCELPARVSPAGAGGGAPIRYEVPDKLLTKRARAPRAAPRAA